MEKRKKEKGKENAWDSHASNDFPTLQVKVLWLVGGRVFFHPPPSLAPLLFPASIKII